jgi:hypothetical protein
MTPIVAAFVSRRWHAHENAFRVEVEPVHGGLEGTVARAHIVCRQPISAIPPRLIVKQLPAGGEREAPIYEALWRHLRRPPTARVLGMDVVENRTYLYLEDVEGADSWPWSDTQLTSAVCRELARFHDTAMPPHDSFRWDYESELARSAALTLAAAERARVSSGVPASGRLGDLRRVVAALPAIRRRLLRTAATVIHGDMHPGNVLLRHRAGQPQPVLIDWGRARLGSPMEDIASWLHSLGCWEPQARRRHDTLMRAYLEARREPRSFSGDVRVDYWLASASNGLSGAIRYHLAVLTDSHAPASARDDSGRALMAWYRVVRHASALLRTNSDC